MGKRKETKSLPPNPEDKSFPLIPIPKNHKFKEQDDIFCKSEEMYYQARIEKVAGGKYHVHYLNWNRSHDEKISFNEANDRFVLFYPQNEIYLYNQYKLGTNRGKPKMSISILATSGKTLEETMDLLLNNKELLIINKENDEKEEEEEEKEEEQEEEEEKDTEINEKKRKIEDNLFSLTLPQKFKDDLIKDYKQIVKEEKLYKLPMKENIQTIINNYKQTLQEQSSDEEEIEMTQFVLRGIIDYFDSCCVKLLLYKIEQKQVEEIQKTKLKSKKPSELYGYAHLLRFFTKFPTLLAEGSKVEEMTLRKTTVAYIQQKVEGLYNYLEMLDQQQQQGNE
ncbi:hypothetical protein ABK040_016494 [Willaertia magna]